MTGAPTRPRSPRVKGADAQPAAPAETATQPSALGAGGVAPAGMALAWPRYITDVLQRGALFLQALVERGDVLLEDERAGLPLRLKFPYETVLDARDFPEPAGYSLLRILPDGDACFEHCAGANPRPVIVFDPRAGHAPGIGGFRRDSELGMALPRGNPVYFVARYM